MTLTRWKLLTGTFGLAVCGIAALAEPASQKSKQNTDVVAQADCAVPPPVPLTVPLPMPAPLPEIATVVPVPLAVPPVETVAVPKLAVTTPADAPPVTVTPPIVAIPLTTTEKPVSAAELAQFIQEASKAGEPVAQPVPAITLPQVVSTPPMPAPVAVPEPVPAPVTTPTPAVETVGYSGLGNLGVGRAVTKPASTTTTVSEKKFKVLLQIGDTLPKFEIRDGEEVLLKVVADKVDVKSPAERSELWAMLKATGQVKFVTPGGEGLCDELQVIPGTGEVVASGSVKFTTSWGKVETAVSSERMTFRLGSAPALAHGEKR